MTTGTTLVGKFLIGAIAKSAETAWNHGVRAARTAFVTELIGGVGKVGQIGEAAAAAAQQVGAEQLAIAHADAARIAAAAADVAARNPDLIAHRTAVAGMRGLLQGVAGGVAGADAGQIVQAGIQAAQGAPAIAAGVGAAVPAALGHAALPALAAAGQVLAAPGGGFRSRSMRRRSTKKRNRKNTLRRRSRVHRKH